MNPLKVNNNTMSDQTKKILLSSLRVFISAFLPIVITSVSTGPVNWSFAFWFPVIIAAVSAGLKAITDPAIPPRLGGTKGL